MPEPSSLVINIAACRPVDTSALPVIPGVEIPAAMQDDTLDRCEQCRQQVWVGPRKRLAADRGLAMILCYVCAVLVINGQPVAVVDLDPGRVERPRTGSATTTT